MTNLFRAAAFTVAALPFFGHAAAQTNISISNTALQTGVKRIGVNLGGPVVPYGSQQLMKNLIGTNPGFNNSIVSSTVPCDQAATATTCQTSESQNYTSGWWGSYTSSMRVMTGSAAGCTSTITNFVPNTFTWSGFSGNSPITGSACSTFAQSGTPAATNYIQVTKTITSSNSASSYIPTWGWSTSSTGSSPTYTTVSDAPTSPDSESIYTQSLQMSAAGSDVAQIGVTADASSSIIAGRNFVNMNGIYTVSFWGKSVSGTSPAVTISVSRGSTSYYVHTFAMTGTWTQYTGTFTASETGTQSGYINFSASVTNATVEVDNFSLVEPTTGGNPTNFRDGVVSALQTLKPGVIRMWDGISETNTLDNMLVNQFARAPANFRSYSINGYPGYYNYISYSIPDALQLCQTVGSECWITMPVTFTPADVSNLIDYLSGDGTTTYGARRISQGQTTPWTSVTAIPKIYLELGNEQWNNSFTGGDMAYNPPLYGTLAQQLFSTMKAMSDYNSAKTSLVLGAQFQGTFYIQGIQNNVSSNDLIDVGPYLMNNVTDASTPNLWNSTLGEPQLLYSAVGSSVCMEFNNYSAAAGGYSYLNPALACPTEASYSITGSTGSVVHNFGGGIMAQNFQAEANSSHPVPFAFYEMSVDGTGSEPSGGLNQSQLNAYLPSLGVGLMNANSSLEGIANGVFIQNIFQLGQDYYQLSGINYLMWGIVEDMGGPTNGKRPSFSAIQLANNAISPGGNMLTVTQTGTPTYTIGSATNSATPGVYSTYSNGGTVNSVAANNIQGVRSFAFSGSGGYGLVMLNNTASSQPVTFSGAAAPTGSVTINTLTSSSPSDNNETTTTTVAPATTFATSPTSYTLPAYSEVTMTWGGSASPAVTLAPTSLTFGSTTVGSSATPQTITLTNSGSASLTISATSISGDYAQTNTCGTLPATISASGTCVFTVTFTPTATGARTGTLTITDNASGSPHTAGLTGTGASTSPATYYVSNSGSDSNNGTSSGTPWQTVAKVNSTTRVPGDTVLFSKGNIWHEQLTASVSGTSGNVITYGAYGTGAAPILDGGGLTTWTNVSGNVWSTTTTTTAQTCHASSTCLQLPNFAGTAGIPVASQSAVTATNDYYFDGVTTLYIYSAANPTSTVEVPTRNYGMDLGGQNYISVTGIQLQSALYYGLNCQSASTGCSNLTLSGNTSKLNVSNGINLFTSTSSRMTTDGLSTNTTNYNGSSGIKVGGYWQSFTFSSNIANYNCIVPSSGAYYDNQFCGGIYVYGAGSSADGTYSGTVNATEGNGSVINGDTAIGNGPAGGTNTSIGNGIWIDTLTGVTVTSETSYANTNNQIYAEKTVSSIFRHNLGYGATATNAGTGCLTVAAGQTYNSKNNVFLENTCDGGYSALLTNFETNVGVMVNNLWQNNIFYQHTGSGIAYLSYLSINTITGSGGGTGNSFVTNGFGAARTGIFYYTASQNTYTAFESAFGASTNSMQSDPALIAPGSGNYGLTSGSPARAAGTTYGGYPAVCGGSHPDLGYLAYACGGTITFSPSAPAVAEGQTVTITASSAVTFTLAGSGTCTGCGTAGQTSVTYTAPSSITPQHVMLGCQVMPNDSVFNTRIDNMPVNSNSATWISGSSGVGINIQPSWGISYANASTPTRTLKSYYGNYTNTLPWPVYGDMKREGGNAMGSTGFAAPDHHVMSVRTDICSFGESYNDKLNGVTITCQDGTTTGCNASSSIQYPWSTYTVSSTGAGVDAAGLPLAALVPTLSEVKAGAINHAMRYTSAIGYIQGNGNTGTPLLWPAALSNGCSSCTSAPIIGARERLKAAFNISTFSATAQTFLLAMQRYGMFLADIGSNNAITTTSDLTEDATVMAAINEITAANIGISNFEFVDESSLEVSANSYQVASGNGYETPLNSAVLTATPASGSAASVPIALEGVTIGSKIGPDVLIQAGSYTWTIPSFVNGSSNQTVTWSLSGAGSLSGAVYTPPSTTSGSGTTLSATLTGTAAADSSATIKLYLTILPTGTIRIDTGAASNTTDGSSNTWLGNIQPEGWGAVESDYPNWQGSNPLTSQYQSNVYAYGNDLSYGSIIVPNGNYDVSFLLGVNSQCGQIPCGSYPQCGMYACNGASAPRGYSSIYTYGPINLESQGQLGYNTYDWLKTVGYVSATPTPLATIPAKVTNNVLYAAVRGISNDVTPYLAPGYNPGGGGLQKAAYLSGLQIAPDGGSPHWTISTQQQPTISSGQTLNPFLVIDWFTGVNDPTWSLTQAPPGITINSATGALAAATGAYYAGQPVTVTATDGTYTATATIYTAGTQYLVK